MSLLSQPGNVVRDYHDALAPRYDELFSAGGSGDQIRGKVHRRLAELFPSHCRVLELNCGTGTDALFLASRKVHVTATDISPEMLRIADAKARAAGLQEYITTSVLDIRDVDRFAGEQFDGVFSNFNGLNYLQTLEGLAEKIATVMKPRAPLLCTLLNRVSLPEVLYFIVKLQPTRAMRRARDRARELEAGSGSIPLTLYFPRQVANLFAKSFLIRRITGFGLLLPPAGFPNAYRRHYKLTRILEQVEDRIAQLYPLYNLSDHYLLELEKRGDS